MYPVAIDHAAACSGDVMNLINLRDAACSSAEVSLKI